MQAQRAGEPARCVTPVPEILQIDRNIKVLDRVTGVDCLELIDRLNETNGQGCVNASGLTKLK